MEMGPQCAQAVGVYRAREDRSKLNSD
jgi:hypothetical protein